MSTPVSTGSPAGRTSWNSAFRTRIRGRAALYAAAGVAAAGLGAAGLWYSGAFGGSVQTPEPRAARPAAAASADAGPASTPGGAVRLGADQQRAIGLKVARIEAGDAYDMLTAPGRVAPDETKYAFITPRAAGVVRTVTAHIGQDVKAGDLLATIDSQVVGEARLQLYTLLQSLEIARTQADWQERIHESTMELLDRIRKHESPETISQAMADRAVGDTRQQLMSAYAQYRLALATMSRNRELYAQKLITTKQFETVTAEYEVAQSSYQSLMDQTGFQSQLANTRAQQALRQAEAAVRAAQERLRILGVKSDGTEPDVDRGRVVGVAPTTSPAASVDKLPESKPEPEKILPTETPAVVPPAGMRGPRHADRHGEAPVSTYSIWAPFDGTVLDREMIVPGVAVETIHRIFTLADLSSVWVEASVHESDFNMLARSRGGAVRFRSPAYPGRVFEGKVIYSGDLVEEKSRTVKLLAEAMNPDRLLKPGMFVEVEIRSPRDKPAARVPTSALLTQGSRTFVFVRTGPEEFAPREVVVETPEGELSPVRSGLEAGDEVVTAGGSKLKAMSVQLADASAK
ncbi:Cobalt-zinc-cadmium resistance protein CzcB [Aquisphaera giovannonii]|uniref:Cobalt-zinc-cadmium resistance protein CzcB n=1 Tax=Aquisphaera giovannonii TaxID=406548 RepID=A0A5B9W1N0_9BACT|nr:efflux RND transporter periplasmic adaptor subunit [Aquisphaera giovannonii]QEH34167.1 Cobalt-zinc-cadmium resistance protein CzcB [Aquisphaera giovannonii]